MKILTLPKSIFLLVATAATLLFTGCGGGAVSSSHSTGSTGGTTTHSADNARQRSLSTIASYAQNPNANSAPSVNDYHTLGIESVTSSNIEDVNLLISRVDHDDVKTQEGIKNTVAKREQALHLIMAYASNSTTAQVPTLETYQDLSIAGVHAGNLNEINYIIAGLTPGEVDTIRELLGIVGGYTPPIQNHVPTVNSQTVTTNEDNQKAITLTANDADGDNLTYQITQQPTHGSLSGTAPNITYIPTENFNGSDSIKFKVNDSKADSNEATITITVNPVNDAPIANTGADQTVTEGATVTLDASASSDSDGSIVSYEWKEGVTVLNTNQSFSKSDFSVRAHTITLTVTDNDGATATDTVVITVNATANQAPTANAGTDKSILENQSTTLRCQGSDTDGVIANYRWLDGAVQISTSQNYTTPTTLNVGTHTYTCEVTDDGGVKASDSVNVMVLEVLENLMLLKNDSNITKKIKILGMGSGGSHHLLFHHSDGETVIECGDMGAPSISHDGGVIFQQLVLPTHAKDVDTNQFSAPRLISVVEHPTNPDWLFGVGTSGILAFSEDRGVTWHSKDAGPNVANNITIRKEGDKIIAYFASGYKHGRASAKEYTHIGAWVDITDIPHDISRCYEGKDKEYNYILRDVNNTTGYQKKYYYGDIVRLGTAEDNKLFVAGKGGLFVSEGDPKDDDNWKNITDSIFVHKDGVFPIDHGIAIGNKIYILAHGNPDDVNNTAGVYVHTRGDITNGKYNFTRIYDGLNLQYFDNSDTGIKRLSGLLLAHEDTSDGKTYLYLFMKDVVYRLDIESNSTHFERLTATVDVDGKTYSKGRISGIRGNAHWNTSAGGSYTSFDKSEEYGTMNFGTSCFPSFSGINTAYSFGGKIYVSNTIEFKVSSDNGKTFNSYTSKVSNSNPIYDGKIKEYYDYIGIFENNGHYSNSDRTKITPTDDAVSFWWSGVSNVGMDNMVSTGIAINPNNPKEMIQSYMDLAFFFSDDAGESWHYIAGVQGELGDADWVMWIKDTFYAQDYRGIYRFDKNELEFKVLNDKSKYEGLGDDRGMLMSIDETVRVRRYYDEGSDTLVVAGYGYHAGMNNVIWVLKNFTDDNSREIIKIKDSRGTGNGVRSFEGMKGESRTFKDVYCDGEYVYAINAEFGIIKMSLSSLPESYNNAGLGLDENEYVFTGLFDKAGNALLSTAIIEKLDDDNEKKVQLNYYLKYHKLSRTGNQSFKLKKVSLKDLTSTTVIEKGDGLTIDGTVKVAKDTMLTLLGIDPNNKDRVLASISNTKFVIESKDGGKTWKEFLPAISGNNQAQQKSNAVFAPNSSVYDVIIMGVGSTYGVLR